MKNINTFDQFNRSFLIGEAKKARKEKKEGKKEEKTSKGLSAKQKKLPEALQKAILSRKKK